AARRIAPRRAGRIAALLVLAVAAEQARLAVEYDRFLSLDDTRSIAGRWLAEHAAPDAVVLIPGPAGYVNPVLPPNGLELGRRDPARAAVLRSRLGSAVRGWSVTYLRGSPGHVTGPRWHETYVVTSAHPALFQHLSTPLAIVAAMLKAGGR